MIKNKYISKIIMCCLVFGLICEPAVVCAADTVEYDEPQDTIEFLIPNCYDVGTSKSSASELRHYLADYEEKGYQASEVEGISWNPDTATLTLDGYHGGPVYLGYLWKDKVGEQKLRQDRLLDVTVEIRGENTITSNILTYMFYTNYLNVTFTGDGTLTFDDKYSDTKQRDVLIYGNLTIDGPTVNFINFKRLFEIRPVDIHRYQDGKLMNTYSAGETFTLKSGKVYIEKNLRWLQAEHFLKADNGVYLEGGELVLTDNIDPAKNPTSNIGDGTNGALIITENEIEVTGTKVLTYLGDFYQEIPLLGKCDADSVEKTAVPVEVSEEAQIYELKSRDVADCEFSLSQDTFIYDGTAKEPAVLSEGLTGGEHYEYEISDNVNVGTGQVLIKGIGDFTGEKILDFTIVPRDISDLDIEIESVEYIFDGTEKKPGVSIPGLLYGEDYVVSYSDNIQAGNQAKISISGIGNYSGTVIKTFSILAPADSSNGAGGGSSPGGKENITGGAGGGTGSKGSSLTAPKKGSVLKDKKFKYKVTKRAAKKRAGELQVTGLRKKSDKKIKIGAKVKIGGYSYKITSIGKKAFKNKKKLAKATIGKNIKKIGASAFEKCKKLKKITIQSKKLKKIGKKALKGTSPKLKIKCPKKKKKAYKKLIKKAGNKKVAV